MEETPTQQVPIALNSIVLSEPSTQAMTPVQINTPGSQSLSSVAAGLRYPAWFSPLAAAAESRPMVLLLSLIALLILVFSAGVALGYIVR